MERRQRFVLLVFATILCAQLLWQGHGPLPDGRPVAFVRSAAPSVVVRLKGAVAAPGIYAVPDGVTVATVMKMTAADRGEELPAGGPFAARVRSGDVIEVAAGERQPVEISMTSMGARERMLLRIPLRPDEMDVADWDALPGIGPALARAIVADRQNHGDFGRVEALLRVPGIGEKLLRKIERFF